MLRRSLLAFEPLSVALVMVLLTTVALSGGPASLSGKLSTGLIYLILVVGLYVFVGNSGVLSFGHAALMAVGGYTAAILVMPAFFKPDVMPGLPAALQTLELGSVAATLMGGLAAALVAAVIALPLVRVNGLQAGLATVALLLVVRAVLVQWDGVTGGAQGLAPVPVVTDTWVIVGWAVLALVLAFGFQVSPFGLRLRASREDETAARAAGVRVRRERAIALVLSGFLTGIGGALFVQSVGVADPNSFYISTTFLVVTMLVVGGMTTLTGAVTGAIFMSTLSQVLLQAEQGSLFGIVTISRHPGMRDIVLSAILLLVLLLRPAGLAGGRELRWPRRLPLRRRQRTPSSVGADAVGTDMPTDQTARAQAATSKSHDRNG